MYAHRETRRNLDFASFRIYNATHKTRKVISCSRSVQLGQLMGNFVRYVYTYTISHIFFYNHKFILLLFKMYGEEYKQQHTTKKFFLNPILIGRNTFTHTYTHTHTCIWM